MGLFDSVTNTLKGLGGSIFGSPSTSSSGTSAVDPFSIKNTRLNQRRADELYKQLMEQISGIKPAAETAYNQQTGELSKIYPEVMDMITTGTLPEATRANLENLRNERVNSVSKDIENLIGSRMADYAGRGVTSSSTAEGVGAEAGKALAPVVSEANQDYYKSLIEMPGTLAANRYNLASNYGTTMGNATMQKVMATLQPLFNMYGTTSGLGSKTLGQTQNQTQTQNIPLMYQLSQMAPQIMQALPAVLPAIASLFCWVAEELYGADDPKTHLARAWVGRHDNAFTRMYRKHGRAWAAFLKRHLWAKPIVQPIWDFMWISELLHREVCDAGAL
jgi:hypothetical protein